MVKPWLILKAAFLIACLSLVASCAGEPRIRTVVQTVEVTKPVFCKPAAVDVPVYPTDSITGDEDIFELAKIYAATLKIKTAEIVKLRAANGGAECPTE